MIWGSISGSKINADLLRNVIQTPHFRLASSARCLLFLLLKQLYKASARQRDEVLIPGYTCYSVAAAVVKAGLKIKVYDIEPYSFDPDLGSLQRGLSEKTLAVISQHLFGIPGEIGQLHAMANSHGAKHIEDAAQAMGDNGNLPAMGTQGDFGLYSFGRGKPLPLGKGGLLAAKSARTIASLPELPTSHGTMDLAKLGAIRVLSQPVLYRFVEALPLGLGETHFDPSFIPLEMPSMVRRLLMNSLPLLSRYNAHRGKIADSYRTNLPSNLLMEAAVFKRGIFTRYPIKVPSTAIVQKHKHLGMRQMYPKCLIDEGRIRKYIINTSQDTPGARELSKHLVTLPTHTMISTKTSKRIANAIRRSIA
jgi:dTDP-4-amino-4,6-dideoxygalactose transaminase